MTKTRKRWLEAIAIAAIALGSFDGDATAETLSASEIATKTHIHGLAIDRNDPNFLFIATHHGLFRAGPDGKAERVSVVQDFMGFNAHPTDPATLYASGHPPTGGNLGFIGSTDGGRTWSEISSGVNGPVDFHQMTVSPADPATIYGAFGGLQVSHDSGRTFEIVAPLPERLVGLAASAKDKNRLYAATEAGLLVSADGGKQWNALIGDAPATVVEVTPTGRLYAFVPGRGLIGASEDAFAETILAGGWGEEFFLHLAVDPTNPDRLFAATGTGDIVFSVDGGKRWRTFGD